MTPRFHGAIGLLETQQHTPRCGLKAVQLGRREITIRHAELGDGGATTTYPTPQAAINSVVKREEISVLIGVERYIKRGAASYIEGARDALCSVLLATVSG
jgi:hypothetical protein